MWRSRESEDEESGNEDVEILSSVKENQSDQQENTCLIREDLASLVVENTSKETKNVKKRGKVYLLPYLVIHGNVIAQI